MRCGGTQPSRARIAPPDANMRQGRASCIGWRRRAARAAEPRPRPTAPAPPGAPPAAPRARRAQDAAAPARPEVRICTGKVCKKQGSEQVRRKPAAGVSSSCARHCLGSPAAGSKQGIVKGTAGSSTHHWPTAALLDVYLGAPAPGRPAALLPSQAAAARPSPRRPPPLAGPRSSASARTSASQVSRSPPAAASGTAATDPTSWYCQRASRCATWARPQTSRRRCARSAALT